MKFVRITDYPAVEAGWLRSRTWWEGLSSRERVLVGTLGTLLGLAILVYGVIRPLQSARAEAMADIRTYETLNARIRAAGTLGPRSGAPPRTGPAQDIVTQSAAGFGLVVQVEAVPGGVLATVAEGNYDTVLNWMADVARTSALTATRVDIQRREAPGKVFASVEYRG